ncbi:MAG: hypothetical protein K0R67_2301, partial [Paenibacillus sp.]|nr:hypothetical protein [Paenibacillus sp.]
NVDALWTIDPLYSSRTTHCGFKRTQDPLFLQSSAFRSVCMPIRGTCVRAFGPFHVLLTVSGQTGLVHKRVTVLVKHSFGSRVLKTTKKLPPLWDESLTHAVPPKFPRTFASTELRQSITDCALNAGSALIPNVYDSHRNESIPRDQFLPDHVPKRFLCRFSAPPALCNRCMFCTLPFLGINMLINANIPK